MKLIVGCGYLGLRVARRWIAAGHAVAGVVQSEESAAALAAIPIRPIVADVTQPETLRALPAADTLLYCVGYREKTGTSPVCRNGPKGASHKWLTSPFSHEPSRWAVYVDGLRATLNAAGSEPRRVILISSTGVYAEHSGGWVNEDSPCGPARESGRALLAAEKVLAEHRLRDRGIVLRLAGIYGPGRLPRHAELAAGGPLTVPEGRCVNLIHVDDAAAAVLAAEERAIPPRTYVVADGCPVDCREYLTELARQLGLPRPSFRHPQADHSCRAVPARQPGEVANRRGGNKRADNRRMLDELQMKLLYPTYREGLKASTQY